MLRDLVAMGSLLIFIALSILAFFYPIHLTYLYLFLASIVAISSYVAYSRSQKLPEKKNGGKIVIPQSLGEVRDKSVKTPLSNIEEREREKKKEGKKERKEKQIEKEEDSLVQLAEKILNE